MSTKTKTLRGISHTTLRRLRYTPTYFFLIWRWTWWFYAFAWIMLSPTGTTPLLVILLGITFIQSLVATLYTPVFKIFFPTLPRKIKQSKPEQGNDQRVKQGRRLQWTRNRPQPIAVD